jgi:hypothetical protein
MATTAAVLTLVATMPTAVMIAMAKVMVTVVVARAATMMTATDIVLVEVTTTTAMACGGELKVVADCGGVRWQRQTAGGVVAADCSGDVLWQSSACSSLRWRRSSGRWCDDYDHIHQ